MQDLSPSLLERAIHAALRLGEPCTPILELCATSGALEQEGLAEACVKSLEALATAYEPRDGVGLDFISPVLSGEPLPFAQLASGDGAFGTCTLRIGSWNIKNFGSEGMKAIEYDQILEQMKVYDICAVQELIGECDRGEASERVRGKKFPTNPWLQFLSNCYSEGFDWIAAQEKTGTNTTNSGHERGIIFFRYNKLKCLAGGYLGQHKRINGERIVVPSFHRTPYAGLFYCAVGGVNKLFWVVNVHFAEGRGGKDAVMRRREMELVRNWCEWFGNWPAVIAGDFNVVDGLDSLDVFDLGKNKYVLDDVFHGKKDALGKVILHPTNSTEKNPERFDRILFDSRLGVLCFFYRHPLLKIDEKKPLSDHRMIGISICFRDIGTLDSLEDVRSAFEGNEHLIPLQMMAETHTDRAYVFTDKIDLSFHEDDRELVHCMLGMSLHRLPLSLPRLGAAEDDCKSIMLSFPFQADTDRL